MTQHYSLYICFQNSTTTVTVWLYQIRLDIQITEIFLFLKENILNIILILFFIHPTVITRATCLADKSLVN